MRPFQHFTCLHLRPSRMLRRVATSTSHPDTADDYLQIDRYILGWFAVIGFSLYYWIPIDVFPQRYENLEIFLVGFMMSLLLPSACRRQQKKRFVSHFYGVLSCRLLFFSAFRHCMKHGSAVWLQSLSIAVFILFHLEMKLAFLAALAGASAACSIRREALAMRDATTARRPEQGTRAESSIRFASPAQS